MKYFMAAVVVFLAVVAGMLAKEGLMTKESFMKLIGREPVVEVESAPELVPTLGGSVGEKLAAREKELEERQQKLVEEEDRLKTERSQFEKLRAEIDLKLSDLQGGLDTQDADQAKQLKQFAEKIAGMNPKNAATLVEGLDVEDAIRVLEFIEARKSAKILDAMDDDKRTGITQQIVGGT